MLRRAHGVWPRGDQRRHGTYHRIPFLRGGRAVGTARGEPAGELPDLLLQPHRLPPDDLGTDSDDHSHPGERERHEESHGGSGPGSSGADPGHSRFADRNEPA